MYATATPSPINVNILRLRFMIDCQKRTKKAQPPQTTTGVARASSIQTSMRIDAIRSIGFSGRNSLIAIPKSGTARATLTQNLRVMSTSSGFVSSSSVMVRGSNAMPQIGQEPGASETISGCIGHVYSTDRGRPGPLLLVPLSGEIATVACSARLIPTGVDGFGARYLSGSALNFSRQPNEQKKYVCPWCSNDPAARCGSTFIPHTGSIAALSAKGV